MRRFLVMTLLLGLGLAAFPAATGREAGDEPDYRNIRTGFPIPAEGYCDQPYVVKTNDGNWLCLLTTGPGREGDRGQHVVATISSDRGRTWSPLIDLEPQGPPEASWVMPIKTPGGRVYAVYTYNTENLDRHNGQRIRADTIGQIVFKYSDDHGRTWSRERYVIPSRVMALDRENFFGGRTLILWGVGKPVRIGDSVYFGASKVGHPAVAPGPTQGIFFRSDNVLWERDPARVRWEMLPEGDVGLRAPRGHIAEEHNLVGLSDGSLYCTYRTVDGYLCAAVSRDGGRTWGDRLYAEYAPGGRPIKNPRGPAFVRRFSNGKYLLLFYNHSGRDFQGRNPYWITGGVERNGTIHWAQPEVCLYDDDPRIRIGYPDYIEEDGRFYLTETNKEEARLHELDRSLLEGLWGQWENRRVARRDLALSLDRRRIRQGTAALPTLPSLARRGGFTLDFRARWDDLGPGQVLLDSRDETGRGLLLVTTEDRTLRLELSDGRVRDGWDVDPGVLRPGKRHHVVVTVDGGPKLITWVVDGELCDGGRARQHGWHRFPFELDDVNGAATARLAPSLRGELGRLRVYRRALRTSEAVGNYQSGR